MFGATLGIWKKTSQPSQICKIKRGAGVKAAVQKPTPQPATGHIVSSSALNARRTTEEYQAQSLPTRDNMQTSVAMSRQKVGGISSVRDASERGWKGDGI